MIIDSKYYKRLFIISNSDMLLDLNSVHHSHQQNIIN